MLKNYFKIAWRNLVKSKGYSLINISGLAIGVSAALLIGLWIWDELSFNDYHQHHRHIAQLMITQKYNNVTETGEAMSIPVTKELRARYPDNFKHMALTSWNEDHILSTGDKKISTTALWVQPDFPGMLTLRMVGGDRDALKDPSSLLLTESAAKSVFGDADPVGKSIKLDNQHDMKVAGVFEDLPKSSSFYGTQVFLPWDKYVSTYSWVKDAEVQWAGYAFKAYVELSDNADLGHINTQIVNLLHQQPKGENTALLLHPMDKWHLYGEFKDGRVAGGRIQFVWLFGAIGIFVLLLACINFMNLSTARSEKRAKEVGIRKAIGSLRAQLIGQFLSESVLVSLLSMVIALVLVAFSLSWFNKLTDKQMSIPWGAPLFWLIIVGFAVLTGLISGSYPALYLSGFKPIKVLKGSFRVGRFAALPRKMLVVLQFTVSITLIMGTIIVFRQIQYAKNRPVGYTREGLISINMNTPDIYAHYDALRRDLLATGAVVEMAEASGPPTDVGNSVIGFDWAGKEANTVPVFGLIGVTHDFGKAIGWQMEAGRDFSRDFPTDTNSFILNAAAVKLTGFKDPVGKIIKWHGKDHVITGVVADMVMESPYQQIRPAIFFLNYSPNWLTSIILRTKPSAPLRESLAKIEPVFNRYNPGSPFLYKFVDEEYARKFSDEQLIGDLATVLAIIAIFISCLGLFGLTSFVTEQRTKEIGMRKVLGASVFNLWRLLTRDFVLLVGISYLIAIPLGFYFLQQWLRKYEYRMQISWWIFAVAGGGALVITVLTVSYQTVKAALVKPVTSLKEQ